VEKQLSEDFKRVDGKARLLYRVAEASLAQPDGTVREVVYKVVGEQRLKDIVKEYKASGTAYHAQSDQDHLSLPLLILLSQLHLSLFTDSAQRTKIHWCLVRQNRDVRNHFRKHAARPRAGPFLAPASSLAFHASMHPKKEAIHRKEPLAGQPKTMRRSFVVIRTKRSTREMWSSWMAFWLPTSGGSKQPVAGSLLLSASTRTSCGGEPQIAQECERDFRSTPEQAHFSASSRDGERPLL
jgi:hypothetical protein